MAKQSRQVKRTDINHGNGRGSQFEHNESIDDSLLPESTELLKLKEIDPTIIEWIKERTAKEQDARLAFNDRKMGLLEYGTSRTFVVDMVTVSAAFVIIMSGMGFSAFLIHRNQNITGSIFAGLTLLYAANAFLNYRHKLTKKDKDAPKQ